MDMGEYVFEKNENMRKEGKTEEEIYDYWMHNIDELGDNGCIVAQLVWFWEKAQKYYRIQNIAMDTPVADDMEAAERYHKIREITLEDHTMEG